MAPFLDAAGFWSAFFFATGFGAGFAGRTRAAKVFFAAGFLAAVRFFAARGGLTAALTAAFFAATAFLGAGFFAGALTAFFAAAGFFFTAATGFFGAGFFGAPTLALPAFFLVELADLRFDAAIILHPCRWGVALYSPIVPFRQHRPCPIPR